MNKKGWERPRLPHSSALKNSANPIRSNGAVQLAESNEWGGEGKGAVLNVGVSELATTVQVSTHARCSALLCLQTSSLIFVIERFYLVGSHGIV